MTALYYVKWIDSALRNDQVDSSELPEPNIIQTVGWLSKQTAEYIVISRDDHSESENAYEWRGNCAIPTQCILERREIKL